MKLTHLKLQGARGVSLETSVDPKVPLLVTGPPGCGKTTLLEAIAAAKEYAGAYGMPPRVEDFGGPGTARITVTLEFELFEQTEAGHSDELRVDWSLIENGPVLGVAMGAAAWLRVYDTRPERWKMEYFDASRRLGEGAQVPREGTLRLSKSPSKYSYIRRFLESIEQGEATAVLEGLRNDGIVVADAVGKRRSRFQEALAMLAPNLRWEGGETRDGRATTWFARPRGPRVELAHLADNERAALLFAATWVALGLERSLVLVDHPELHLHPEQHAAFFEGLSSLMRRGQLIATTSSPAILRNTSAAKVLVMPQLHGHERTPQ